MGTNRKIPILTNIETTIEEPKLHASKCEFFILIHCCANEKKKFTWSVLG